MGKRILITSFGSFGDVYPYIGLALGLRARGHDPVLAMPRYCREVVEREGLRFHAVPPDVEPSDRETIGKIMDPAKGTEFLVREVLVPALRASYESMSETAREADLLITHPVTFAAPVVAERLGLPWVSTVLAPMSLFSAHDLPVFAPMPWAKNLERVPGGARALVGLAKAVTRRWTEPIQALRREFGLPRAANPLFEGQHSPGQVLALFSRTLADPQPDWPPNVCVTGAIPYNGPETPDTLPRELEAFLEAGPPPLVFTLGTSAVGAPGSFYEESLEAVRRLGMRAVLLVGPHPENLPRAALPAGVRLEPFAPHAALFPRAAAIVHQGGIGTLHQGLRSGRPTLVVPFAHDQFDNAHRVWRLGVSRTLPPNTYRAGRVVMELRSLLENGGYRVRAEEIAAQVRQENGVEAACDAIERVLESNP
ncbi:MAG: glycosyltransferase family 1 protein [Bryobacterales bacterium]|nr:glycosyltransferase family 1 protein [Bryobacterales bacterium]